ncbi:MAG: sulfatase-like hydrolase/transferase [Puniceicoccales bacterium]
MNKPSRRNVLLIVADDHRFDALGCMGNPTVQTPHFDELARTGFLLRHHHCMGGMQGAVCVPSRAIIYTGKDLFTAMTATDPCQERAMGTIAPENLMLPEHFRNNGYQTHFVGKWHNDKVSLNRGFEGGGSIFLGGMGRQDDIPIRPYDPTGEYPQELVTSAGGFSTEVFAASAREFLHARDEERPFFLTVALTSPHDPRMPPEPYASLYRPEDIPIPADFMPEHPFDNGELMIRDETLAPHPRTPERVQKEVADYYGMISHHDAFMGTIMSQLKVQGLWENTLVIYTSDHGLCVGSHGLMGKQNVYDPSVRVPLIIGGGAAPQGCSDAMTNHTDLISTLSSLAGLPAVEGSDGIDLSPYMLKSEEPPARILTAAYKDVQSMASDGHWKFIRYRHSERRDCGTERIQLFHLDEDPYELNDLSEVPACAEQIERLSKAEDAWWSTRPFA